MTTAEQAWLEEVQQAATEGDRAALVRLFATAHVLFGADAEHKWAEALSAFDASAITG
jgi:hypothetical protein